MKRPVISDFHTVVTEAGVNVTFKPTNSVYTFYRRRLLTRAAAPYLLNFISNVVLSIAACWSLCCIFDTHE